MVDNYSLTLPQAKRGWMQDLLLVVGSSIIIGLCAPISIPLPFTPVPLAVTASVILFLSGFLGSKRAALAVMCYLAQGMMGLPVFAGGLGGIHILAGPTGGYLLGYIAGAFLTGFILERSKSYSFGRAFTAMAIGNIAIYVFGVAWLSRFIGLQSAFVLGVLPFVVGDCLKLVLLLKGHKSVASFLGFFNISR